MRPVPISVHVRVRPSKASDGRTHEENLVIRGNRVTASTVEGTRENEYIFDKCHGPDVAQEAIYKGVQPLLDRVFKGENATIFAYGVTGSGKTHTMQGTASDPGVIPRVVQAVFDHRTSSRQSPFQVSFSYVEILKEDVLDLMAIHAGSAKLDIRTNARGEVLVPNLNITDLSSFEEFEASYAKASRFRSTASTNLNANSSRSHAILTIYLDTVDGSGEPRPYSKICMCDLAGSENNRRTGNNRERMQESAAINQSLTVLGNVVNAIVLKAPRIPYRDSKLTRILQDALGGGSLGMLVCCLAPGEKFEADTINSLNFAMRTQQVQNKPLVNLKAPKPKPPVTTTSGRIVLGQTSMATNANTGHNTYQRPRPSALNTSIRGVAPTAVGQFGKPVRLGKPEASGRMSSLPLPTAGQFRAATQARLATVVEPIAGAPPPGRPTVMIHGPRPTDLGADMTERERKDRAVIFCDIARAKQIAGDLVAAVENYEKAAALLPNNWKIRRRMTGMRMAVEGKVPVPAVSRRTQEALAESGPETVAKRSRALSPGAAAGPRIDSDHADGETPRKRLRG